MNEVSIKFDWIDSSDDVNDVIEIFTLVRDKLKLKEEREKEALNKSKRKRKVQILEEDDDEPVAPTQPPRELSEILSEIMIPPEEAEKIVKNYNKDELQRKTMKELKELCKEKKVIGYSKLNKDNLILKLVE